MDSTIEGGCLCDGVRYRLHEMPADPEDCHCIDCRRASGAPFVTWGSVRKASVELLQGELRKVRHAGRLRSFASCCGTQLFFQWSEGSEWIDVTIATLDHPESFAPQYAIWTEDRLPWITLDPSRPAFKQRKEKSQAP
ncbi:MAG TPA: GFA family protein [Opitutaceae bacterium]